MKRGDKVVYVGLNGVRENPHAFYPEIGTVGVVVEVGKPDILVKWDDGSTSNDDRWWCYIDSTKPYTPSDIDTTELDAFMNEMIGG